MSENLPYHQTDFVKWRTQFPWLHLLRVPGVAARMQILLVGFVTSYLLMTIDVLTFSQSSREQLPSFTMVFSNPVLTFLEVASPNSTAYLGLAYLNGGIFTSPWGLLGTLFIHLISGLIICRLAASVLTTGSGICLERSFIFSFRKLPAFAISLLFPIIAISVLSGLIIGITALERIPTVGPWLAGIGYGLALVFSFLRAIMLIGLVIGWPLLLASLMVEKGDGFDAWSRGFDYLRSRLVPILIAFILTLGAGILIEAALGTVTDYAWSTVDQTVAWSNSLPLSEVEDRDHAVFADGPFGFQNLWKTLWVCLIDGFLRSYYWVTVVAVYLSVRWSVDRISVREFEGTLS